MAALAVVLTVGAVQAACGKMSWYGTESGNRTANGEYFDGSSATCAHRSLAFGTVLTVTFNGRKTTCRINDRGPAAWTGRDLDLSRAVAKKLGMIAAGIGRGCWTKRG